LYHLYRAPDIKVATLGHVLKMNGNEIAKKILGIISVGRRRVGSRRAMDGWCAGGYQKTDDLIAGWLQGIEKLGGRS
jgi:hypothetical protein